MNHGNNSRPTLRALAKKALKALPILGGYLRETDRLRAFSAFPPGHYYSPIPDFDGLKQDEGRIWAREGERGIPGIDLNEQGQLELLDKLACQYPEQPFHESKRANLRYYFKNDFFSFSDGIFYFCMLRHLRPRRVVEIGSGFSSALLLDTSGLFFGTGISCTFIDPDPIRLQGLLMPADAGMVEMIPKRLQDVATDVFSGISAGDILFIDSSHVSKIGSDVNMLLFEILPKLQKGVYVHIHDVFYPFEYPREYVLGHRWAWNELYAIRAFLSFNSAFQITLFPSFLERFHGERLQKTFPLAWNHPPRWPTLRGASLWIKRV